MFFILMQLFGITVERLRELFKRKPDRGNEK